MSGPQFFETRMGQVFFEGTMPRVYRAVNRLADAFTDALTGPREYKVLTASMPVTTIAVDELNKLAKEGWRIAHVTERTVYLERVVPRKEQG